MIHIKRRYEDVGKTVRVSAVHLEDGKVAVIEPKNLTVEQRNRIQELRNVLYATFIGSVPERRPDSFPAMPFRNDLYAEYKAAKDRIRNIAIEGGASYDKLLLNAKYAWTRPGILKAVRTFVSSEFCPS